MQVTNPFSAHNMQDKQIAEKKGERGQHLKCN